MAEIADYHKLEHDAEALSETQQDDAQWMRVAESRQKHKYTEWLRLLFEATLVLLVIGLGLKVLLANGNFKPGRNEPSKDCTQICNAYQFDGWTNAL
jgi:hypothetical protein